MSKNQQQGKFEPVKEAQEQNLPGYVIWELEHQTLR